MEVFFPVLGAGSSSGKFLSRVSGKYLDRPLSSLKPFPTIFKWSILRRIEGLELIYIRAIPPLMPETQSLTRYLDKNYVLNAKNLINISLFVHPTLNFSICSPEGSSVRVVYPLPSFEHPILVQEVHSYRISNYAPNPYRGPLEEREKSTNLGYRLPVVFQRRFAAFHDGLQKRCRTAHQGNVDLGETDRPFMTESDGRGQTIRQRPPVNLLHEEKFIDTFPKRSGMGETRPRFEGTDRLSMTESDGRSRMMIVHSAPAIIREVFSGFFEKDSEVEANLRIRDPAPLIAHGVPASMNKSLSSKWDNSKAFAPQISKPSFENSPPLDFAEDLDRSLAGINATASDPRRIYRRYPELEHVEPVRAKIIEEREVLRENKSEPDLGRQFIDLNLNRLSDQVYSLIEKRIRIERERRGLYG